MTSYRKSGDTLVRVERKSIYPYGSFDIDPATGLPVTPKNMFFRVKRLLLGGGYWEVQLRKGGAFSTKVESRTFGKETPIDKIHVLEGAAHALRKYRDRQYAQKRTKAKGTRPRDFLGDYPPKKVS